MTLDRTTLEWVLKRIRGLSDIEYYDYCPALDTLEEDVKLALEKGIAWDEVRNESRGHIRSRKT